MTIIGEEGDFTVLIYAKPSAIPSRSRPAKMFGLSFQKLAFAAGRSLNSSLFANKINGKSSCLLMAKRHKHMVVPLR
jgi:hypothetical protein